MAQTVNVIQYAGYIGVFANRFSPDSELSVQNQLHPLVYQGVKWLRKDLPFIKSQIAQLRTYISEGSGCNWGAETEEKLKIVTDSCSVDDMLSKLSLIHPQLVLKAKLKSKKKKSMSKKARVERLQEAIAKKSEDYLADAKLILTDCNGKISYRALAKAVGCSVGWIFKQKEILGFIPVRERCIEGKVKSKKRRARRRKI